MEKKEKKVISEINIEEKPDINLIIEVYKQNWEHLRHLETARQWFAYIYLLSIVGVLAFISKSDSAGYFFTRNISFCVLLIFAILGFFLTIKLNAEFKNIFKRIEKIVDDFKINKEYVGFPISIKKINFIRVRYIFMLFYVVNITIWIVCLIAINFF